MQKSCSKHGFTNFTTEAQGNGKYRHRCKRCIVERQLKSSLKVKTNLVNLLGGSCKACGYNKYLGALEFHHLDRNTKCFNLGIAIRRFSYERCLEEVKKCILLCSNCHKELEGGLLVL